MADPSLRRCGRKGKLSTFFPLTERTKSFFSFSSAPLVKMQTVLVCYRPFHWSHGCSNHHTLVPSSHREPVAWSFDKPHGRVAKRKIGRSNNLAPRTPKKADSIPLSNRSMMMEPLLGRILLFICNGFSSRYSRPSCANLVPFAFI